MILSGITETPSSSEMSSSTDEAGRSSTVRVSSSTKFCCTGCSLCSGEFWRVCSWEACAEASPPINPSSPRNIAFLGFLPLRPLFRPRARRVCTGESSARQASLGDMACAAKPEEATVHRSNFPEPSAFTGLGSARTEFSKASGTLQVAAGFCCAATARKRVLAASGNENGFLFPLFFTTGAGRTTSIVGLVSPSRERRVRASRYIGR
mmetsp:Transcript_25206/g.58034  ORF Transcript_25206/g.58034 Transcript_25206/m.58034 type:complete len:208 (-) Transcript_25206:750-1373(-)